MIALVPLDGPFGAELTGLDLADMIAADPVNQGVRRFLLDALHAHGLLLLRCSQLAPAGQIALARLLGPLYTYPTEFRHLSHPEHAEIGLVGDARSLGAQYWHTDGLAQSTPPSATLLYPRQLPLEGGDTLFVDARAAYDRLPPALQRQVTGRRMVYDEIAHPMVRVHPVTARRALYLELMPYRSRIEGMPSRQKEALVRELIANIEHPELVYRHRWHEGDLLVWDNAAVLHRAAEADSVGPRLLHRVTVRGTVPV